MIGIDVYNYLLTKFHPFFPNFLASNLKQVFHNWRKFPSKWSSLVGWGVNVIIAYIIQSFEKFLVSAFCQISSPYHDRHMHIRSGNVYFKSEFWNMERGVRPITAALTPPWRETSGLRSGVLDEALPSATELYLICLDVALSNKRWRKKHGGFGCYWRQIGGGSKWVVVVQPPEILHSLK